jgi:hypothetical protein
MVTSAKQADYSMILRRAGAISSPFRAVKMFVVAQKPFQAALVALARVGGFALYRSL